MAGSREPPGHVLRGVPSAAGNDDARAAELAGEVEKLVQERRVPLRGVLKARKSITYVTIHPVLQDDEVRAELAYQRWNHAPEEGNEGLVPGAGGSGRLTLNPSPSPCPVSLGKPVPGKRVLPS